MNELLTNIAVGFGAIVACLYITIPLFCCGEWLDKWDMYERRFRVFISTWVLSYLLLVFLAICAVVGWALTGGSS